MTYELAKQLKDAGFPEWYQAAGATPMMRGERWDGLYEPTLSELIEACGNDFFSLAHFNYGWVADSLNPINMLSGRGIHAEGSSPEEAVAKLWLVLNAKEESKNSH